MAGYKNSAYYLTPVLPNTTYTITYVLRKSSNFVSQSGKRIFLRYRLNQNDVTNNLGELILDSTNVTAEFTTYTKTFTTGALINPNSYYFQVLVEEGLSGEIELSYEIKLERGSTATPYQPNLLDDPYWVGKAPLGENIADPTKKFPIKSSGAEIYTGTMTEPFVVGETYTVTLKGTKPADKNFRLFNPGIAGYGNLSPVEGVTDVWSLTVTVDKVAADPRIVGINQTPADNPGACQIDWLKIEKGDTRTQNISEYKYFGEGLKDSNNPNDYSWDIKPEYTEKGLNDSVSLTEPETILGLKNFAEGLQSSGVNVAVEYAKAIDTDKYTKHGAIYLGGCAWLAWETLTFQKTEGYAKGSYIRLGADGNASFTYSDVPNIFGGYLWLGGVCQPDYTDGGFGSYHITVENNFDDARKPIVRVIDSPSTPVKKLAVRGFALVFAPAPTENSQVKE